MNLTGQNDQATESVSRQVITLAGGQDIVYGLAVILRDE